MLSRHQLDRFIIAIRRRWDRVILIFLLLLCCNRRHLKMTFSLIRQFVPALKPLVVTGVARSGTRMVSDILLSSQQIVLEDEMHAKTLEAFIEMIDKVDANFDYYSILKGKRLDHGWAKMKPSLFRVFLNSASKGPQLITSKSLDDSSSPVYYGIKTPGYERYYESFEKLFAPEKVLYIYCIRNAISVWRSWLARGFLDDVNLFLVRYKRSLRQALKIVRLSQGRIAIFNLDSYIALTSEADRENFFAQAIIEKLRIQAELQWPKAGFENANSAARLGVALPRVPPMDVEAIDNDEELANLRELILRQSSCC